MKASWMKYSQQMIECTDPKEDVQQKAREIQAIVDDPQFWKWVKKYEFMLKLSFDTNYLKEPAAISNPLQ
jgi:hypothetical protein